MTPAELAAENKLLSTKIVNIGFELIQTNQDLQRIANLLSELDPQLQQNITKRLNRLRTIVYQSP